MNTKRMPVVERKLVGNGVLLLFRRDSERNKGYCRLNGEAIFSHLCGGKCMCGGDATEKDALDGAKLDLSI